MPFCSLGLDFGTSSVRALIVDGTTGRELGVGAAPYAHGEGGVLGDPRDPAVARQHPGDWGASLIEAVREASASARSSDPRFDPGSIIGIGIDATASTPLPVDARGVPLALHEEFSRNLDAQAWLWKDHTSHAEAGEITGAASRERPDLLARCGGAYSSEWYFSKLLRCLRAAPAVMAAADGWVEEGDYIAGLLTGSAAPRALPRNVCAAAHKAMYDDTRGLPDIDFLSRIDPRLGEWCRGRLYERALPADMPAGRLARDWADRLGLRPGTAVAVAAIDAHVGAVGAGIRPGVLVKILGTSSCDMLVHPASGALPEIPGICGVAMSSILPGYVGLEAGQSAVGDIFGWFVREIGKPAGLTHDLLTAEAAALLPGETGLLALDWHNGNRSVLSDPRLTGALLGLTLATRPAEIYRALIEATAFGARVILDRFSGHGVRIDEVIASGGIAGRSDLLLQIYADVLGRPLRVSRSQETCALGAAIFGAVAARRLDPGGPGPATVEEAQAAMTGTRAGAFEPRAAAAGVYGELHALYLALHDAFGPGTSPGRPGLSSVMKKLISIRERARSARG